MVLDDGGHERAPLHVLQLTPIRATSARLTCQLVGMMHLEAHLDARRSSFIRLRLREADTRVGYTRRLCSMAAAMKLAKSGWGANGRDFSSG